jgi:alanine racemase
MHNGRMPRPIEAVIHAQALRHNLDVARAAAPGARVFAVVKANAYGHGIERVIEPLRGADGFALLDIAEAERVRAMGWRGPILLLEGCFEPRDLEACSRLALWHVVHSAEQIDWLAAHKTQAPQRVFLKLNSGMNRLGFRPDLVRAAWSRLAALPQVGEITLMTHFADADRDGGIEESLHVAEAASPGWPGPRAWPTAPPRCAKAVAAPWPATGCAAGSCSTAARPTSRSTTARTGNSSPR